MSLSTCVFAELLLVLPQCLEKELIEIVSLTVADSSSAVDECVKSSRFRRLVEVCSCNAEVFQATSSVLHKLLYVCSGDTEVVALIRRFVVEIFLTAQDPVSLYPLEYRNLVHQMKTDPCMLPADEKDSYCEIVVQDIIKKLQCADSNVGIVILLCHFPFWVPFVVSTLVVLGKLELFIGKDNVLSVRDESQLLSYLSDIPIMPLR